jgi:hypothetical protein
MKLGTYQHFRNKQFYEVIGVALHSETREEMVVYKMLYSSPEYDHGQLWVRPKSMFLEKVDYQGQSVPRFAPIEL